MTTQTKNLPDVFCKNCGASIMYGEKSQEWLSFVWVGFELTSLCSKDGLKHSPKD